MLQPNRQQHFNLFHWTSFLSWMKAFTFSTAQGLSNCCQLQLVNCNITKRPHVEGGIIQQSFPEDMCSGFLEHLSQLLVHLCHLPNVQKVNFFKMQPRSLPLTGTVATPAFRCAWLPLCSPRQAAGKLLVSGLKTPTFTSTLVKAEDKSHNASSFIGKPGDYKPIRAGWYLFLPREAPFSWSGARPAQFFCVSLCPGRAESSCF